MSVLVDKNTRLLVQGITGGEGTFHTRQMIEYGTNVVAGVVPGKGGQKFDDSVPIFNTVDDAVRETGANAAAIFVPPPFAADAIMESADAGVAVVDGEDAGASAAVDDVRDGAEPDNRRLRGDGGQGGAKRDRPGVEVDGGRVGEQVGENDGLAQGEG